MNAPRPWFHYFAAWMFGTGMYCLCYYLGLSREERQILDGQTGEGLAKLTKSGGLRDLIS